MKVLFTLLFSFFSFIAFSQTVTLDGSGSVDVDGSIVSYQWKQVAGPSTSTITNATSVKATASNFVAGIYQYELTVTDNEGAIGKDTMQLTVLKANIKPKADAGPDQTIQLTNSFSFKIPFTASNYFYAAFYKKYLNGIR